jgi:hypothetical protein
MVQHFIAVGMYFQDERPQIHKQVDDLFFLSAQAGTKNQGVWVFPFDED